MPERNRWLSFHRCCSSHSVRTSRSTEAQRNQVLVPLREG
jgi:hypothetical protein